jgi:hypothetical protein
MPEDFLVHQMTAEKEVARIVHQEVEDETYKLVHLDVKLCLHDF